MVDGEWVVAEACGGRGKIRNGFQIVSPSLLHTFIIILAQICDVQ